METERSKLEKLIEEISSFVDAVGDRSIAAANRIEVALDEVFGRDERFESYVTDLALYRPLGGEGLIDEHQMVAILRELQAELAKLLESETRKPT